VVSNMIATQGDVCSNPARNMSILPASVLSAGLGPTAYQLPHCSCRDSHAEVNRNPSQDHGWLRAGSSEGGLAYV
jgi:hypothetical protein